MDAPFKYPDDTDGASVGCGCNHDTIRAVHTYLKEHFPQFGLRLADGGALVLYGMYLNTSTQHPNLVAGSPIQVPAAFRPLLAAPTEIGKHAIYADWTYQFAAIDPPSTTHNAKLQIIAAQGGPTYGHAS